MQKSIRWTNRSVLALAEGRDPIVAIEERVRAVVLDAMDRGWVGPPFDPLELAGILGLRTSARDDLPDARTVSTARGMEIEFNPRRPRGRVRFSIAHEIVHTFFPDCAQQVRNRGATVGKEPDGWQLEMLCNIGAAELLMPTGSFEELEHADVRILNLLELRKKFDVSIEALLVRVAKLARKPLAVFCASLRGTSYRLDYVIPAAGWVPPFRAGDSLPDKSIVQEANAIGYTAAGSESWGREELIEVECIALAPYPGETVPRVVGLVRPPGEPKEEDAGLEEVVGDALAPRGNGARLIVQVVPDSSSAWGGRGFAAQVKRRFPAYWQAFRAHTDDVGLPLRLGSIFEGNVGHDLAIVSIVAQRGVGPSSIPRIRYAPLKEGLDAVGSVALSRRASVHIPKVGTGHGGGDWRVIRELLVDTLVARGVRVTVYHFNA